MSLEDIENARKRLIYRSWHRGTKEMDLLMGSFADKHASGFTEPEIAEYARILEYPDPDLYDWITGVKPVPANVETSLFSRLKAHKFA